MINLSVSNIAWNVADDEKVAAFLVEKGITSIEIAPTKYFPEAPYCDFQQLLKIREYWESRDLSISSIQSLFFGHSEIQIIQNEEDQSPLTEFFFKWGSIGQILEVSRLVLGGPNNRKLGEFSFESATDSFHKLINGLEKKWKWEHQLVLEANPLEYGCEFITKTSEAVWLTNQINSPILGWNLDTACTLLGGEDPIEILINSPILPSHVHISTPNLAPLDQSVLESNKSLANELTRLGYKGFVTLEMKTTKDLQDLYTSLDIFCESFK